MQRPTAVTVFGVLNIIVGVLGLLGFLMFLLSRLVPEMAQGSGTQAAQAMQEVPSLRVWKLVGVPIGLIGSLVAFVTGIGLLMMKSWARVTAIVYGVFRICMSTVGFVIMMAFIVPAMSRMGGPGGPAESAVFAMVMFGAVVTAAIALTYNILLVYFMTRHNVVEAFRANATPMQVPAGGSPDGAAGSADDVPVE